MRKLKLFIYATVIGFSFCFAMEAAAAQGETSGYKRAGRDMRPAGRYS